MSELPAGWAAVNLGELADFEMGQAPPGATCNTNGVGTVFVKAGEFGREYPVVREWTTQPLKFARAGDVLICVVGATSGKLNLGIDCAIGRSVAAIRPSGAIQQKTLYRQLLLQVAQLRADSTGTAQGVISKQMLSDINLVIPPLPEQTRITDQLDKLLSRVHFCNDRLDTIPALLKRFRQAVLESALYGAFLDDEKPTEVSIASIAAVGTGSTPLRSNARFFASSGTPWITSAATSHQLITEANEFVTPEAIADHRLKRYPKGTLLVAMYGEGKTRGQVAELGIEATINQACAAVVVDETKALIAYVKLAFQVNYLAMRELAEGGNQPNLNLSKVKEFRIPLPSLEQQERIVREANSRLQVADRIEARYTTARIQAQRLSLLLLGKAFRGELVPQDPNEESASALLERISAGHEKAAAQPRARKSSAGRKPVHIFKGNANMTKSRQDDDVQGQPYLARHLRLIGGTAPAEALFKVSELPVADFYKQLAWEVANGYLRDGKTALELGDAA